MDTPARNRPRAWRRMASALVLGLGGVLAATTPIGVGAQVLTEAQLRARFVLNFVRFTEWPARTFATADLPLAVCVLGGSDAFDGALLALNGASAGGHPIEIRNGITPEEASGCHLLFIPDSELRRLAQARDAIGRRAVLIVGESEAALDRGANLDHEAEVTVDRA